MMPEKPSSPSSQATPHGAESRRLRRTPIPERSGPIGSSVCYARDQAQCPARLDQIVVTLSRIGMRDDDHAPGLTGHG